MPGRLFRNGSVHGALHEPDHSGTVVGDVLELPPDSRDEILATIDRYEGIGARLPRPAAFRRERVTVIMDADGSPAECWAWLYNLPVKGASHIRHGDILSKEAGPRGEA